jgi:HSP20 family protein
MSMSQNNLAPNRTERMERRPSVPPPVDIYENADEILVVADVPGARTDGIMVRLEKNELYLHARRDEDSGPRSAGTGVDYTRTFVVPPGIAADGITAEMTAGVLRIHLPKDETAKPRKIAVRSA